MAVEQSEQAEQAFKLVGFAMAHAAWSVSDGSTLCTLAFTEDEQGRQLYRFDAGSIPESLEIARQHLSEQQASIHRWVLIFDGFTNFNGTRIDALVAQVWTEYESLPIRIIQNYKPGGLLHRFKIIGQPVFVIAGDERTGNACVENKQYEQWFLEGVQEHEKVATLWPKWFQAA
jgi:hypothetical protein